MTGARSAHALRRTAAALAVLGVAVIVLIGTRPAVAAPGPTATYASGGDLPFGITLTPDGRRAVVANVGSSMVAVLDLDPDSPTSGTVLATFPVPLSPIESAYALDGFVYVSDCTGTETIVIDAEHATIDATLPVGGCFNALSPDGRRFFIGTDAEITVVDVDPGSAGYRTWTTIPVPGHHLGGLSVSPDGTRLYSVANLESVISVLDVEPGSAGYGTHLVADVPFGGSSALGPVLSADGTRVFLPDLADGLLRVFDAMLGEVATIPVSSSAATATIGPDDRVYVTAPDDGSIVVIDPESLAVVDVWTTVGDRPMFLAFAPDGAGVYVTNATQPGSVTVLETPSPIVLDGGVGASTALTRSVVATAIAPPPAASRSAVGAPTRPAGLDPATIRRPSSSSSLSYSGASAFSGVVVVGLVAVGLGAITGAASLVARSRLRVRG